MSKRLQVLLPDDEMSDIKRLAKRELLTVGEWVRRALRDARASRPVIDPETKLKAVRREAQVILERLIAAGERLVTDAEVLQEILHRYAAIEKREAIGPALQVMLDLVDQVLPIEKTDVLRAGEIAQNRAQMSARDAVHIAIMERHGIRSILSFDVDFDRWPGLHRIHRI